MLSRKGLNSLAALSLLLVCVLTLCSVLNLLGFVLWAGVLVMLAMVVNNYYLVVKGNSLTNRGQAKQLLSLTGILFAFVVLDMLALLIFQNSLSSFAMKLLSALLCLLIFSIISTNYLYEGYQFYGKEELVRLRFLCTSYNPRHPAMRVLYLLLSALLLGLYMTILLAA